MAVISARVEFASGGQDVPEKVWYAFPRRYKEVLSVGSEPFAAALLLPAMFWGEEVQILGQVSPKFAYGLQEYSRIFHIWMPKMLKAVEFDFKELVKEEGEAFPTGVATAFSGGVDSSYTLRENLGEAQPLEDHRLTHGVFIHGFDIDLHEAEAYRSALRRNRELFTEKGLELIPVQTNTRLFTLYRMDWGMASGGPLIGAGLALGGLLRRFYIPSGYSYHEVLPNGNSPLTDQLLSTERLEIVHHGAAKRHNEKMDEIAHWDVAHKNLRVCIATPKPRDGGNCSVCNKCLINRIRFEMLGVHSKFETFAQPFERRIFLRWWSYALIGAPAIKEIMRMAVETGRWDLWLGMWTVRLGSWANQKVRGWAQRLLPEERFYAMKKQRYGEQVGELVEELW